jgi:hypothetical protein
MDNNTTSNTKEKEENLRARNVSLSIFFSMHIFLSITLMLYDSDYKPIYRSKFLDNQEIKPK